MWAQRLGTYITDLTFSDIPETTRHAAKRCLLDYMAGTLPGGLEPPALALQKALSDDLGHGKATLMPSGLQATARTAALINGVAAHTLEVDDIYREAIYHPGPPVISAAIATAQQVGASGAELLTAVIAGYEISNRIGAAVQPTHYNYWHTTGTVGAFGAVVAASKMLKLTAAQTKHAIANAATMAAGLLQAFSSDAMSKPLHAGRAAETGVLCAQMAAAGVTGADAMLEGPRGFGNAMSRDVDWQAAFAALGTDDYTITRMTQKNHSCCGHTFAGIDAILALREQPGFDVENIQKIHVASYGKALEVCGNRNPKTPYEAKFSMPYTAAMAALEGRVRLAAFAETWLADAALQRLMAKVEVTVDDKAEAAFPSLRSATVTIDMNDGSQMSHYAPTRKGDPDNPLSDQELEDKFRELAGPVLGAEHQEAFIANIWQLDQQPDLPLAATGLRGAA